MEIIKVKEKATGNIIEIKDFRFNPELHQYLEVQKSEIFDQPGIVAAMDEALKDTEVSVSFEGMKMQQLRSLAKEKGLVVDPSTKKVEIIALLKKANEPV